VIVLACAFLVTLVGAVVIRFSFRRHKKIGDPS
jgi:hypothetical protein